MRVETGNEILRDHNSVEKTTVLKLSLGSMISDKVCGCSCISSLVQRGEYVIKMDSNSGKILIIIIPLIGQLIKINCLILIGNFVFVINIYISISLPRAFRSQL